MVDVGSPPPQPPSSADIVTAGDTGSPGERRRRHPPLTTRLARSYTSGMTLSVIIPTRNRAELWRSGWVLDALAAQTQPPDELVIALDHTDDDTLAAIRSTPPSFPLRVLETLSPRASEHQASAIADNCLFAAASNDILIHLDDDIAIGPDFCRRARGLLRMIPSSIIWAHLRFVNADHSPIIDHPPVDRRPAMAAKHRWPMVPRGLFQLPPHWPVHWGGAWAAPRAELLAIGGHDLNLAKYRNADARLGNRLVRAGFTSYVTGKDDLAADHLGTTHHARRRHGDRSRGPTSGPTIANGGLEYWTSNACRQSYREI